MTIAFVLIVILAVVGAGIAYFPHALVQVLLMVSLAIMALVGVSSCVGAFFSH